MSEFEGSARPHNEAITPRNISPDKSAIPHQGKPESNPIAPPRQEQPTRDTSDLILNSVMREWAEEVQRHRELEVFKEITKGKSFGFTPEESAAFAAALNAVSRTPTPSEVKEPTPEELDRMAEEELARLKSLKTMTERIDHALIYSGLVDRMARLDPEYMAPIKRGLARRDAVLEKKLRARARIYQRRGWDNPQDER